MDPKQERALRDGTASEADQPRDTDLRSVREQAENPPVTERSNRQRRKTAAVADVRVNQDSGTPVDQMAREIGAPPVPETGRAPRSNKRNGDDPGGRKTDRVESDDESTTGAQSAETVPPREARRTLKARREHSKGDGNFPAPEPSPQLMDDERPEDRSSRDLPKSRDDRSAPKGNITLGQDDRNPNLQTRDDQRPGPPSRAFSLDAARDAAAMPNAAPRPRPIAEAKRAGSMRKPTKRTAAKRTAAGTARAAPPKGATPKRATPKRATPKRAAAKRTGIRQRN